MANPLNFRFQQLVVRALASEHGRKLLLNNPDEIRVNEGDAFTGQLFVAANIADMRVEPDFPKAAIAGRLEVAEISHTDIQKKLG